MPNSDQKRIKEFELLDFFLPSMSSVWKHDKPTVTTIVLTDRLLCKQQDQLEQVALPEPILESQTCRHISFHEPLS